MVLKSWNKKFDLIKYFNQVLKQWQNWFFFFLFSQILLLTCFDTRWHKVMGELETSFKLIFEKGHPVLLMWRPSCKLCSIRKSQKEICCFILIALSFLDKNNELLILPLQPTKLFMRTYYSLGDEYFFNALVLSYSSTIYIYKSEISIKLEFLCTICLVDFFSNKEN